MCQVYLFWFLNINKYSLSEAEPGRSVEYKDTLGENTESAFFSNINADGISPNQSTWGKTTLSQKNSSVKQLCDCESFMHVSFFTESGG